MTSIVGTRFDITSISAGTVALAALDVGVNAHLVFGVTGNELIVFKINYP